MISGGLTAWAAHQALKKLGEYSSAIDTFNQAADAHPTTTRLAI